MKNFSKDKIAGIVGTLLVHILVFGLLWLLVLKTAPPPPEKGIEVMMGVDIQEQAMAQVNEAPPVAPEPAQVKPTPPAPKEPLLTQDSEESVQLPPEKPKKEKPKKKEKTPEQIQKEKEQAERIERERKEKEEAERVERERKEKEKKINSSVSGAFANAGKMSSKVDDDKTAGSPTGNSDAGQTTGVGVSFSLDGRTPGGGGLVRPVYNVQEDGRVVVDITVNPAGKVIVATINLKKSTPGVAVVLREAALKAARSTFFNSIGGVDNQMGTITYNFELK